MRVALLLVLAARAYATGSRAMAASLQAMQQGVSDDLPAVLRSGPFTTLQSDATLPVPEGPWGDAFTLKLYLASPLRTPSLQPRSVPVVMMFNGFQLPAAYYAAYRNAFSSWGYAALSYDVPGKLLKRVIRDDYEIQLLPLIIDWLHQQSMNPASALYEIVDTRRVAGFGHSRGAKLAALALAADNSVLQAAVLLDPVDMTATTTRQGYPSAVDALTRNPKPALLIGAGVTGWCNPADEGYAKFWPVLSSGSWLHILKPAGHMQFLDVKGVPSWALDRLCGTGNITHKVAIHMAQGAAVAWLQHAFRPEQAQADIKSYLDWVVAPEQQTLIDWQSKGADSDGRQGSDQRHTGTTVSESQRAKELGVAGAR